MQSIRLEGIERAFGGYQAVRNVDLDVRPGEFLTLLGPSGCGKTTTLRMVAGLEHNTKGRIWIGDTLVSDADRRLFVPAEQRKLGMVFQSYAIWPHMTVFGNVAYPLRLRHRKTAEIKERVSATLRLVGLENASDRSAMALSGGQQQRVAIARALVYEPEVLLLDEPLSNLDAKLRERMGEEFRSLQKRLGITCLYVTHDQEEAMAISDRIVVMDSGEVLQVGAPDELYQRPDNITVATFFGSPNVLPATVRRKQPAEDGTADLLVDGTGWTGRCRSSDLIQAGAAVQVVIRPEHLVFSYEAPAVKAGQPVFRGTVVNTVYKGARRTLSVQTGSETLTVDSEATVAPKLGEQIYLRAAPHLIWAVS
jgi:iron(III) transport system ATP-binding protein